MTKFEKFVNEIAEVTAIGFNMGHKINSNSDEYIDYFG